MYALLYLKLTELGYKTKHFSNSERNPDGSGPLGLSTQSVRGSNRHSLISKS